MTNIKITLRKDTFRPSTSIEAEAEWMAGNAPVHYSLQEEPRRASPGCWVYFVRDEQLVARSRADGFRPRSTGEQWVTDAKAAPPSTGGVWEVACSSMEIAPRPIPHPGFEGFQYVADDEELRFTQAFESRRRVIRRPGGKKTERPPEAKRSSEEKDSEPPPLKWTPG